MRPKRLIISILTGSMLLWGVAHAHMRQAEPQQSMRQSYFALLGMTLHPMGEMVKGNIPWDASQFASWANDLASVSQFSVERAFGPGSEMGQTRAQPDIWLNMDDFKAKLAALRLETSELARVADSGDAGAIRAQFGKTARTCKSCHDDYKADDYLY
jgi:cytochrome c556